MKAIKFHHSLAHADQKGMEYVHHFFGTICAIICTHQNDWVSSPLLKCWRKKEGAAVCKLKLCSEQRMISPRGRFRLIQESYTRENFKQGEPPRWVRAQCMRDSTSGKARKTRENEGMWSLIIPQDKSARPIEREETLYNIIVFRQNRSHVYENTGAFTNVCASILPVSQCTQNNVNCLLV